MSNLKNIVSTVILFFILFVKYGWGDNSSTSEILTPSFPDGDSVKIILYRDSLLTEESRRVKIFYPKSDSFLYNDNLSDGILFRTNAISYYELFPIKKRVIPVRGGISSSLNKIMAYGNTVPLTKIYYGTSLLYYQSKFYGDEGLWITEYNETVFKSGESIFFKNNQKKLVSPEAYFLWENGVFDENILYVNFSRPLTRRMLINVFSNYRYFKGQTFTHEGNDVYSFYSNIFSDTMAISRTGYNPLVNEYSCGINFLWEDEKTSSLARIKYGDLVNEVPLNTRSGENISYGQISNYPLDILYTLSQTIGERYYTKIETEYFSQPLKWKKAISTTSSLLPLQINIKEREIAGAFLGGINIDKIDSVAVQVNIKHNKRELFDSLDFIFSQITPKIVWRKPFTFMDKRNKIELEAGYDFYISDSLQYSAPIWLLRLNTDLSGFPLHFYSEQNILSSSYSLDSIETIYPIHNSFLRSGIEIEKEFSLFYLLLGYQWCSKIDTTLQKRAWISGYPPYFQPTSSFIISPQLKRFYGTAASFSFILSDKKPYLKLQSDLSFSISPKNLDELFDIRLNFVYWSNRDTIIFAGKTDWNKPVIDVGITTTVHIKTFRLFYKIDNILNRKFSYIPGYYSPGINFRWGFSWFLQK